MAVALVNSRTAPLVAVYAAVSPGLPTSPAVDEMLTMEPPPACRIAGIAAFVPRKTPLALTAMMRSHSDSLVSSIRARNRMPALLTRTFSMPYVCTAVATAAPAAPAARREVRQLLYDRARARRAGRRHPRPVQAPDEDERGRAADARRRRQAHRRPGPRRRRLRGRDRRGRRGRLSPRRH